MNGSNRLALLLPNLGGGGAERVALSLANHFVSAGHQVDLVLLQARGELLPLVPSNVRIIDLNVNRIRNAIAPLQAYLRREKPDALQALMWPLTVAAVVSHRLSGSNARLVVADHTTLSRSFSHVSALRKRMLGWSIRRFYPMADARVVVSAGAAADLSRLSGLPLSDFDVIFNPVEARWPETGDRRLKPRWRGKGPHILTVGSLRPTKGHTHLIRSFARSFAGSDAELAIVGEGDMRAELLQTAADHGVQDQLHLPGFVSNPEPWYASADLFVLPSRHEGYPLVLAEALRSGLPIVSTDCESGPTEILDGGRYGHLVPVDDEEALAIAMANALTSPHDPERARRRAQELSGDGASERYLRTMVG